MSRSIHTTRRTFARLRRQSFARSQYKIEALKRICSRLNRKRRIKKQVSSERRRAEPPLTGTAVDTIPIKVLDESQLVHHPASVHDIRTILSLLPDGATEGISRIQLLLGKLDMEDRNTATESRRDPFTGRMFGEAFLGVYLGRILGTYHSPSGLIQLYAFVYDPNQVPVPLAVCEIYLRLHALKTLVHEVAHHFDNTKRVRRGRWLFDRKENFESYAEAREHDWTRQIIVPYLEKEYPRECRTLQEWVAHRGGPWLPMEFFAGDCRRTERSGGWRLVYSTSDAFESWLEELPGCAGLSESRRKFAVELYYAEQYDLCLEVVQRVLDQNPDDHEALVCRADTFVHLRRLDEAMEIADRVLAMAPRCSGAWRVKANVLEAKAQWQPLLQVCDGWEGACPKDRDAAFWRCAYRAVACCGLEDIQMMDRWIHAWVNFGTRKRSEANIRRMVYRRAGRPLPASPVPDPKK